jgi:hypothetical protein
MRDGRQEEVEDSREAALIAGKESNDRSVDYIADFAHLASVKRK